MESASKTTITVKTTVNANIEKTWNLWNTTKHITKWNSPSPD